MQKFEESVAHNDVYSNNAELIRFGEGRPPTIEYYLGMAHET
jgi:hypothetical protein